MSFASSSRDRMLDALVAVLKELDGVEYADRQAITADLVADSQLPAVLIDEVRSDYAWWERHGDRAMRVQSVIVLDLQIRTARRTDGQGGNASTARELFVNAVLGVLANDPTLGGHAADVASEFSVAYVKMPAPYARALITLRAEPLSQCFDDRTRTAWRQLILDTFTDREHGERVTTTYDLE